VQHSPPLLQMLGMRGVIPPPTYMCIQGHVIPIRQTCELQSWSDTNATFISVLVINHKNIHLSFMVTCLYNVRQQGRCVIRMPIVYQWKDMLTCKVAYDMNTGCTINICMQFTGKHFVL
jgi:hypothetical protein